MIEPEVFLTRSAVAYKSSDSKLSRNVIWNLTVVNQLFNSDTIKVRKLKENCGIRHFSCTSIELDPFSSLEIPAEQFLKNTDWYFHFKAHAFF